MKLRVNPLVVAAALGLLGPAALAGEAERPGPAGLWRRVRAEGPSALGALGDEIEVLDLDDRVFLDEGLGGGRSEQGTWTRLPDGDLRQELVVDGVRVAREFRAGPDALDVWTEVERDGTIESAHAVYARLS